MCAGEKNEALNRGKRGVQERKRGGEAVGGAGGVMVVIPGKETLERCRESL